MDIRQLHHFLTVIKCGSLGRAAKELDISEPALSKSIRRMEDLLQVRLLDRSRRGITPTAFGRALASHAEFLTSEWGRALTELGELRGNAGGISRVGTAPSFAAVELAHATARLHDMHPGVTAIIRQSHSSDLIQAILDGALDFAVITYDGDIQEPDIVAEVIGENPIVIAARPGHALSTKAELVPADLAQQYWIVPHRRDQLRIRLEMLFARHNLERPFVLAEASGVLFTLSYLQSSDALAYMPRRALASLGGERDFAVLSVRDFQWSPPTVIIRRRKTTLSAAARTHMRLLKDVFLKQAEAGRDRMETS